jgi:hypothetical protein
LTSLQSLLTPAMALASTAEMHTAVVGSLAGG